MTISNKTSRIFLDTEKGMDINPEINDREILILIDLIRNLLRAFLAVVVVVDDVGIVVPNRKHFMVDNDGHEVKKNHHLGTNEIILFRRKKRERHHHPVLRGKNKSKNVERHTTLRDGTAPIGIARQVNNNNP